MTGSGEEHEINYSVYISRQNLISVNDGREIHFLGIKTDKGITPVSEILPYEGMPEELINLTKLGKATAVNYDPLKYSKFYDQTVARREGYHKYYWKIPYYAKQSEYFAWLYAYYAVETRNGVVEWVRHYPEYETVPKNPPASGSQGSYRPSGPTGSSSGSRPVTTTKKPAATTRTKLANSTTPRISTTTITTISRTTRKRTTTTTIINTTDKINIKDSRSRPPSSLGGIRCLNFYLSGVVKEAFLSVSLFFE